MNYLVAGTRDAIERFRVPPSVVFTGEQTGVDTLAARWATNHGVGLHREAAPWDWGRIAGPVRNARLIRGARANGHPAVLVALPGAGPGTRSMIQACRRARILTHVAPLPTCPRLPAEAAHGALTRPIDPVQWSLWSGLPFYG